MDSEGTRPQPRFRIWDAVQWFEYPLYHQGVVVGIEWLTYNDKYRYEIDPQIDGQNPCSVTESDGMKLIQRPGAERAPAVETLRRKADRLKREYQSCDDKGWFGKQIEWQKAESAVQEAEQRTGEYTVSAASLTTLLDASRHLAEAVEKLSQKIGTGRATDNE